MMMGVLRLVGKPRPLPPMPQEPRANKADDHDRASAKEWRRAKAEMTEGETVVDRPDRLPGKERGRVHRQRGAARRLRQVGDMNLDAVVQHVEAEPEQHEHGGLYV